MNSPENWYQTFFKGLFLELWTKAITPEHTAAEIKFIKEVTQLPDNSTVLDIPCGNGRHSIALAKEGFGVTAIDISEEYIQQLNEEKVKLQLPITTICADIIQYALSGSFDVAVCLGNSFNYFGYDRTLALTKKINRVVKEGGFYIIQTGTLAESILPTVKQRNWMEIEDLWFLTETSYHTEGSVLQSDYTLIKESVVKRTTAYHYVYTLAEVKRLLTEAGFSNIDVYSDFDKSSYKMGDRQAYIVAQK